MYFVVRTGPGVVELNWMWLPTFIGMSTPIKKQIEEELAPKLKGKELTDETLQWASDQVVDIVCRLHPALPGLRDYLDALKFVNDRPSSG